MMAPLRLSLLVYFVVCTAHFGKADQFQWDRFEVKTVVGELVQPMELDIAPGGDIYLIELGGVLKRIHPSTGAQEEIGRLNVTTAQENGLIGLALDPNFSENQWLYLQYSPPDFEGQHVSRFTLINGKLDLTTEKVLFTYQEQRRECCHHAGSLEFGPDGLLYIGTGDNTNPFNDSEGYAPLDQRKDREPWDAQRTAGNTKNYNGKVLRIRPEPDGTYSIPEGNLFPADGSLGHPEIYVMGCRNPWRISVDQRTGILYWGDVGPDAGGENARGPRGYDEINQAKRAGNYGWPYFIGANYAYSIVNFETGEIGPAQDPMNPVNESVNNTGARALPPAQPAIVFYPGGGSEQFPAVGSGGRTACAGPVYQYDNELASETKFPAAFDQALFAYDWSRNGFWTLHFDDQANFQRIEQFLPGRTFVRPIDMCFDEHGSLYVIEYGETWGVNPDAKLVRIDYIRGNRSPVAVATADNNIGREPLMVTLNGEQSRDPDSDLLEYTWTASQVQGEKTLSRVIATSANAEVEFPEAGVYTIKLEVRDQSGASGATSLPVVVGNARPKVDFLSPRDGDFADPGMPVRFSLVVRDVEDGTSDFDESEEGPLEFIESLAPTRTIVEAKPLSSERDQAQVPKGLAMIRASDCLNCHATNRPLVGPSFLDIANKYRDQPHAAEQSVKRVMEGSTGVWGKVGMLPHSQHTAAEVAQMVDYVYSLTAATANPMANGFNNEVAWPKDASSVVLEATYTDLGRGDIPKLAGVATVTLRPRQIEAESADQYAGTQPLGSGRASGGNFMGAINHDGYLLFRDISYHKFSRIILRVASAGAGGQVQIRRGAFDGPLLGEAEVTVNGDWEDFRDLEVPLIQWDHETELREDLYVVFKNEQNRGGLMNVDTVRFEDETP